MHLVDVGDHESFNNEHATVNVVHLCHVKEVVELVPTIPCVTLS